MATDEYQQFLNILNLRWNIMDSLNIFDHINLAESMADDYIEILMKRPSKRKILNDVLSNIDLSKLKSQTLHSLNKSTWKHISLHAFMDESFIFEWSHKIDFFRLKVNENGGIYGGFVFSPRFDFQPRQFTKKFHKIFPGFKAYEPCSRCFEDTQWLVSNTYIKDEKKWFCQDCWYCICPYCIEEDCNGECDYINDYYNSEYDF
jgi:hypothetical protein